jgi:hypothetical protein
LPGHDGDTGDDLLGVGFREVIASDFIARVRQVSFARRRTVIEFGKTGLLAQSALRASSLFSLARKAFRSQFL